MKLKDAITDVPGIAVGHWTDARAATGCTVILCEDGAVCGVDVRGSAPGSRETDLMRPGNLVQHAHAIVLSGGSAFGLDTASGVMRYLDERGKGFPVRRWRIPIVGAAVLFDLGVGCGRVRPGAEQGYLACRHAGDGRVQQGSVGAGAGATVAKGLGPRAIVKGGVGTASARLGNGAIVGAIMAVNAYGDIVDPQNGAAIAIPRATRGGTARTTLEALQQGRARPAAAGQNTTIGVVATSAALNKEQANKLAQMAQDGLALAIRPAHTMGDGDIVFALATGRDPARRGRQPDVTALGALAAQVVARAIVRGVQQATGIPGAPSVGELAHA
ncbi:MAG: peptidase S58 family protein [Dehalococcoidia bacterium]|nr:peptidase S58 family protein [Dehalococcoidia bacterium]